MKRILALCIFVLSSLMAFAELYTPHRYVELGIDTQAGSSNNYYRVDDVFKKNLVIDLRKISEDLSSSGFELDFYTKDRLFLNVNISPKFRLSLFTETEGAGYMNVPHRLFEILGKGYQAGEDATFDIEGYADLFYTIGASFRTTLFEKYGVTFTPAYYVPLVYMEKTTGKVSVASHDDGSLTARADAQISLYSAVSLQKYKENTFKGGDIASDVASSLAKGGFDLSLAVERPIVPKLDVGAFIRIPMVPARLDHKMTMDVYGYYTVNRLMGILDKSMEMDKDYGVGDVVYTTGESQKVWRPFRFGAEAAWRPFGSWFVLRPMIALVVRNPYTSGARTVYPEFSLSAEAALKEIIGINFSTSYLNRVFVQQLGLMLNFRVIELNIKAMLRGGSFVNSFNWTGAGAYVGVRIGF